MRKYWWQDLEKSELERLTYIKENEALRPLYKLLAILKMGYNSSQVLKDILGGNYIVLVKEGTIRGFIVYKKGEQPQLTEKGDRIAEVVLDFLEKLRQIEIDS